jgi:hypothetical protein
MNGAGLVAARADETEARLRVVVLLADGCRVCIGIEALEGVYDAPGDREHDCAVLPDGRSVPLIDWRDVTQSEVSSDVSPPPRRVCGVLRTKAGALALAADACAGIRELSFVAAPPSPTRLEDPDGEPLCFFFQLDGAPHFLLEPEAVVQAAKRRRLSVASLAGSAETASPRAESGLGS